GTQPAPRRLPQGYRMRRLRDTNAQADRRGLHAHLLSAEPVTILRANAVFTDQPRTPQPGCNCTATFDAGIDTTSLRLRYVERVQEQDYLVVRKLRMEQVGKQIEV